MFHGLHDIDWSSMQHAYGSADEVPALLLSLRSTNAGQRQEALDRFYGAVHHQGDVYPCTTASLPFLFELAGDATTPDRGAIVKLLVSIGSKGVERCGDEYVGSVDYARAAAMVRERTEAFVGFAADADPRVRRAAIPGLGLFLDDADRAAAVLRSRLPAEPGIVERLLIVEAMATLALRLPACSDEVMAWLAGLAADPATGAETRLAALVHRVRCAPEQISAEVLPAAIGLLREMANATAPDRAWRDAPAQTVPPNGAPPQIAAAFEDLDRQGRVHAPATDLLRTFHRVLAARVAQRTALLAEQLRSPDPGSRLDAIRMSAELMKSWRGDHTSLITLIAGQLGATDHEIAAEAAAVLEACHPIAEPAREALADCVAEQRAAYGPEVWAAPRPQLRRAHQEAVRALARLGDVRAVPSVLAALDNGVDDWRAVAVAGSLPQAANQLAPRLSDRLRHADLTGQWAQMSVHPMLSALSTLGDKVAYVVRDDRLLVFRHTDCSYEEVGIQVPAGSVRPGEAPEDAALREAREETGLTAFKIVRKLGVFEYDISPYRFEIQNRHVFHLELAQDTPERWASQEDHDGEQEPTRFECFWIPLKAAHILQSGQGALLGRLFD